ncbi:MAG: SpoIIE family protein phosphatase, partial [Planctomycetota bacterium]
VVRAIRGQHHRGVGAELVDRGEALVAEAELVEEAFDLALSSDPSVMLAPDRAYDTMLDRITAIRRGIKGVIWIVDRDWIHPHATRAGALSSRMVGDSLIGKALRLQRGLISQRRELSESDSGTELSRATSALVAPITASGRIRAFVEVWHEGDYTFDSQFMRLIEILSAQLSRIVEASLLHKERLEAQRLRQDLEIGAEIQEQLLLGKAPDSILDLDIGALTVPSQHVDGDFLDFFPRSARCVDVVVGDVMGKGVPAALVGAAVKSEFLRFGGGAPRSPEEETEHRPDRIVNSVHQAMTERLIALERFVTICYARFDTDAGTVTYVDCGHTSMLRYNAKTDAVEALRDECPRGVNLPLGVYCEARFQQFEATAAPGDVFLIYSDGITEAASSDGDLYGQERLEAALLDNCRRPSTEIAESIRDSVITFAGTNGVRDDLSCVVVRVLHESSGERLRARADRVRLRELRSLVGRLTKIEPAWPDDAIDDLLLALTEAASNILRHAYSDFPETGDIELFARRDPDRIQIVLRDWGRTFDPDSIPEPDWNDLQPGGLGVYMIRELVDEVRYDRGDEGENRVTLVKYLKRED